MALAARLCGFMCVKPAQGRRDDAFYLVLGQVMMVWLGSHLEQVEWLSLRETAKRCQLKSTPLLPQPPTLVFPHFANGVSDHRDLMTIY